MAAFMSSVANKLYIVRGILCYILNVSLLSFFSFVDLCLLWELKFTIISKPIIFREKWGAFVLNHLFLEDIFMCELFHNIIGIFRSILHKLFEKIFKKRSICDWKQYIWDGFSVKKYLFPVNVETFLTYNKLFPLCQDFSNSVSVLKYYAIIYNLYRISMRIINWKWYI